VDEGKFTGILSRDKLEGTVSASEVHFVAKDSDGSTAEYTGTLSGDTISGTAVLIDGQDPARRTVGAFTARRIPGPCPGAAATTRVRTQGLLAAVLIVRLYARRSEETNGCRLFA